MNAEGWFIGVVVCTRQRKRQQELAHTLQVTSLEFNSFRELRSVCLERHCKMCLTSSLHAHAFPKMLQIPALDHTTNCLSSNIILCKSPLTYDAINCVVSNKIDPSYMVSNMRMIAFFQHYFTPSCHKLSFFLSFLGFEDPT